MRCMRADLGQDAPATLAFLARRQRHPHPDARHIAERKSIRRRRARLEHRRRGNAQLGQIDPGKRRGPFGRGENFDRGLKAGADALLRPLQLDRAGHNAAQLADLRPFRTERLVAPAGGDIAIELEMDARFLRHRHDG